MTHTTFEFDSAHFVQEDRPRRLTIFTTLVHVWGLNFYKSLRIGNLSQKSAAFEMYAQMSRQLRRYQLNNACKAIFMSSALVASLCLKSEHKVSIGLSWNGCLHAIDECGDSIMPKPALQTFAA